MRSPTSLLQSTLTANSLFFLFFLFYFFLIKKNYIFRLQKRRKEAFKKYKSFIPDNTLLVSVTRQASSWHVLLSTWITFFLFVRAQSHINMTVTYSSNISNLSYTIVLSCQMYYVMCYLLLPRIWRYNKKILTSP